MFDTKHISKDLVNMSFRNHVLFAVANLHLHVRQAQDRKLSVLFCAVIRERGRRLSRNSAAASAVIISTSGFGPTWRLTDGNTDDSPKDCLDLYDGKELKFGFVVGFWGAAPVSSTWAVQTGR